MYKILIVEDEELIRKGMRFAMDFESLDCTVVAEASNGEEGIACIQTIAPDIVITDIRMPLKSGIDMLKETQEVGYSAIVISGYDDFAYAKEAMKYGVNEYLLKPVVPEELMDALERAKEKRDMRQRYDAQKTQEARMQETCVLCEPPFVQDEVVEHMIAYIRKHYGHKVILADVSKALNYSEALLHRRFKEYTTHTFNDYLNRYRIQKAIEMMKEQRYYLYDIATLCGFNDYKYFSSVFKKYVDGSPHAFMAALKATQKEHGY